MLPQDQQQLYLRCDKKLLWLSNLYFRLLGIPEITQRIRFRAISKLLDINSEHIVLDVGCGYGLLTLWLADKEVTVVGVDIVPDKVKFSKSTAKNLNIQDRASYVISSACALPFKENSFDTTLCLDVIEHIPDDLRALSETSYVLKPKGILVLTTPCLTQKYHFRSGATKSSWGHVRNGYSLKALAKVLNDRNLELTVTKFWLKFFGSKVFDFYFNFFYPLEHQSKIRLALCAILFPLMYAIALLDEIFLRKNEGNEFALKAIKSKGGEV